MLIYALLCTNLVIKLLYTLEISILSVVMPAYKRQQFINASLPTEALWDLSKITDRNPQMLVKLTHL